MGLRERSSGARAVKLLLDVLFVGCCRTDVLNKLATWAQSESGRHLLLVEIEGIWEEHTLEEEWKDERGGGPAQVFGEEKVEAGGWKQRGWRERKEGSWPVAYGTERSRANWLIWGPHPWLGLVFLCEPASRGQCPSCFYGKSNSCSVVWHWFSWRTNMFERFVASV